MPAASLRLAIAADASDDLAPLAFAVMKGNMNMVRFLLAAGCSVSLTDHNGPNALLYATMLGDVRAIQFLLDNSGPDLQSEAKDGIGETALHKALIDHEQLSRGIPSLLIKRGANVNATTQDGTTPLMICLRRIGKQSRTDAAATPWRYTALHSSCTALLKMMIACGADIYARGPQGITPLIQAIHCHDPQLDPMLVRVRVLIDAGASLFAEDHGYNALNHAAEKGYLDLLRLLLMNGASYNLVKKFCRTALYPALVDNSIEFVRLLLDLGAHVGARTVDDIAPLPFFTQHHYHTRYVGIDPCHADEEHSKMFNLLLDYGGDVSEIVPRGKSVLHYVFYSKSYSAVVPILVNRGFSLAAGTTNKGSILTDAIIFSDPPSHLHQEVLAYVLENAPPHSVTQDHLNSALLYVKSKGYLELMRLLLEKGADPNSTTVSGVNMLDKAGNPKIPQQPDSSSMNPEPVDIYPPDPETNWATGSSLDAPRIGCVKSGRAELEAFEVQGMQCMRYPTVEELVNIAKEMQE
ncbi:ankyrin repeat-containing domain protein [Morchella snyderi]|nr:ankyrin repeat-containing domain protein [Morchella snyderi]